MTTIRLGLRLRSAVCSTEIMVIRAPPATAMIHCGGAEMLPVGQQPSESAQLDSALAQGTLIGKRYIDP